MTTVPDRAGVLRMRTSAELARIVDLVRLLPTASASLTGGRRTGLADRVEQRRAWAQSVPATEDGWRNLRSGVEKSDLLVDELVALLMTRLLRTSGLDAGTFDAAEAFLDELVDRAGIPALVLGQTQAQESIDHGRASVAMRFPGARVWDLPFLAHEFGHHATATLPNIEPDLAAGRPLADTAAAVAKNLEAEGHSSTKAAAHAGELLADAVATICCGYVYPVACLCLRVPLPGATRVTETHPAWTTRIALARAVLDTLSDEERSARYTVMRTDVVDPLAEALLGEVPAPTPVVRDAALRTVRDVRRHRTGLVHRAADVSINVANGLVRRDAAPPAGASVTTVVDGAWRWRLARTDPGDDDAVAALVADYCWTIAGGA